MNDENNYLFRYALKGVRRNTGRTFFVVFSISLAVFVSIWVVAFFEGFNAQVEKAVVSNNVGYFQIQENSFSQTSETKNPLRLIEYQEKITELKASYSPELVLEANISTPEGATGLSLIGIIPELHEQFLPIASHIIEGNFQNLSNEDGIVIGKELADIFFFSVGDQMVINYQDHLGELRSELLTIEGIFDFSGPSFEKRTVYTHQKTFQKIFFNNVEDSILFNRLNIMKKDIDESILVTDKTTVRTWKNLNPEMAVVIEFHNGMVKFFWVIIGITIIMTVITPIQMLWQERLKEMKMLQILGVTHKTFWKIGLFEMVQMIILSFLFSAFLIIVIIGIQSQTGIDFSGLHRGLSIERAGIILPSIIHPHLTIDQMIHAFIFVTIVLTICYLFAIKRTLKKLEVSV